MAGAIPFSQSSPSSDSSNLSDSKPAKPVAPLAGHANGDGVRFPFWFVLPALIVGGLLRWLVSSDPVWIDELHTSWAINDSLSVVASRAGHGNQAPVYFWLNWIVNAPFASQNPISLRAMSLLSGMALLVCASGLIWSWTRNRAAVAIVAWLIAIENSFVFYSTEARPYVFMQLLSILHVHLFWSFLHRHRSNVTNTTNTSLEARAADWGLILTTTLLFYTHYVSVWLFFAEAIFFLGCVLVAKQKFQLRPVIITSIETMVLGSIGVPHLWSVFSRRGNWKSVASFEELFSWLWIFLLLALITGALLVWFRFKPRSTQAHVAPNEAESDTQHVRPSDSMRIAFVATWAITPIVAVSVCQLLGVPLAMFRYTVVGTVAFPILFGLLAVCASDWARQWLIGAMLVFVTALFSCPFILPMGKLGFSVAQPPFFRAEMWEFPVQQINSRSDKAFQPVILFGNLIEDVDAFENNDLGFQRYLRYPVSGMYSINLDSRKLFCSPTPSPRRRFSNEQIIEARKQGGAWILVRGEQQMVAEIAAEIEQELRRRGTESRTEIFGFDASYVFLISVDRAD